MKQCRNILFMQPTTTGHRNFNTEVATHSVPENDHLNFPYLFTFNHYSHAYVHF